MDLDDYKIQEDKIYWYENTRVLKNKLGLKNEKALEKAERFITDQRQMQLELNPIIGKFDFEHLKKIHKKIFGDLYEFAGEIRRVNMSKGTSPEFCRPEYIEEQGNFIFRKLQKENYYLKIEREEFINRLAELIGDLIALHPFREGNGRTIREFIRNLCEYLGYDIDYRKINSKDRLEAEIDAFLGNYTSLKKLLEKEITLFK